MIKVRWTLPKKKRCEHLKIRNIIESCRVVNNVLNNVL